MGIALGPYSASVDRHIAAPAAAVWGLLIDVRAWPAWGPSVRRAVLHNGATRLSMGARGTVWSAVGMPLPFRVTGFETQRRWSWSVAGVPATDHELTPVADGCRVRFGVPWWAPGYLAVCAAALARLENLASAPDPGRTDQPQ